MGKRILVFFIVIIELALTCKATLYTVGDSSGWDISTDLDTWVQDKRFVVGDSLLFQYSSYHSVDEVERESYEGCNATAAGVLQTSSNGNITVPLTAAGDRYFVCGNKLHCLGGMKLHVAVEGNKTAPSPSAAPQAESGAAFPTSSSSNNNNPSTGISSSAVSVHGGLDSLLLILVGLTAGSVLFRVE
ncbi:hypothetical protein U1Q18_026395 [Sarracenia purpurea var. burkii]